MIGTVQVLLFLFVAIAAFGIELWAFVDAVGRRPEAFSWAGKRTRTFWLLLLGGGALLGFLALPPPLGLGTMPTLIMLGAVIPAAIYLGDVRPTVRGYRGGRRRPPRAGGW